MSAHLPKRIFIIDPCMGSMTGHWENFCRRFYQEFTSRGIETFIICQAQTKPEIVSGMNIIPTFNRSPFSNINTPELYQQETLYFAVDFLGIDKGMFKDGDWFICPTIFPQILKPLIDWIEDIKFDANIFCEILFQFPAGYERTTQPAHPNMPPGVSWDYSFMIEHYLAMAPLLAEHGEEQGFRYFASSEQLANNFSKLLHLPIKALPMPAPQVDNIKASERSSGMISVGYFGHSALEKGSAFLDDIVKATLATRSNVAFNLHINPNPDTQKILEVFNTPRERVHTVFGHLGQEALLSMMAGVDIVLMPYDPFKYKTTPSAIFTECAVLGKVFVIPDGTWMSVEAQKAGCGYVTYREFNAAAITAALEQAIADFPALAARADAAKIAFRQNHGIVQCVDALLA